MNRITQLFHIKYPIIQGGMVWCSGWKLASAVSNQGGLGLLGAGSMRPHVLREHIQKMKQATDKPWGVNVPLLYPEIEELIKILIDERVKIVFTAAGSPKKWTPILKKNGIIVVHVVSSLLFAQKCEEAGVDAIVGEGFEAGGHNGREETTTLSLIPTLTSTCKLPVIAAGGIASGKAMAAAMMLGAEGVQVGSRFAVSKESSAHPLYKQMVYDTKEGETLLTLKKLVPTRMIKNKFYEDIVNLEENGNHTDELLVLKGKGRAKRGIFEGDIQEGELEIGQVSAMLNKEETVEEIFRDFILDFNKAVEQFHVKTVWK